jgi:hypothetical protein
MKSYSALKYASTLLLVFAANAQSAPVYFNFVTTQRESFGFTSERGYQVSVPESVWLSAQTSSQTFGVFSVVRPPRLNPLQYSGPDIIGPLSADITGTVEVISNAGSVTVDISNSATACDPNLAPGANVRCKFTFSTPNITFNSQTSSNFAWSTETTSVISTSSITLRGSQLEINRNYTQYPYYSPGFMAFDSQTGLTSYAVGDGAVGRGYWAVDASTIPTRSEVPLSTTLSLLFLPLSLLVFRRRT